MEEKQYPPRHLLYKLASDQGHASAQYNLGIVYQYGQGVDKDEKRAVEFYTLAADQGHAIAQPNLGCMYELGQETNGAVAG